MNLNAEQKRALVASCNKDVIISAGAGSGKTATLSNKIYAKVMKDEIKPSQLLVLTFTNNAAHEMKERTIKLFKENHSPFAAEMMSAHIQTFDSFSQYLVKRFASRLHLSKGLSVADDAVISAKMNDLLDEIFNEYYSDETKAKRLIFTLKKFTLKDDTDVKNFVLRLFKELDKKPESLRKEYIRDYDKHYLTDDFYEGVKQKLIDQLRTKIKAFFVVADFCQHEYADYLIENKDTEIDIDKALQVLQNEAGYVVDISAFEVENEKNVNQKGVIEALKTALNSDDETFLSTLKTLRRDNPNFFNLHFGSAKKGGKKYRTYLREVLKEYEFLFEDLKKDKEFYLSFKEDIHLFFELEEELRKRLQDYKFSCNYFTFSDFSSLAIRLLTEEEFADCAIEIRNQFKFIMIDEYQDTNDIQEIFLDALTKENPDGTRAHLFCVGDAKQSIYRFRNSNVALFNKRVEDYQKPGEEHEVIPMNRNYRSSPEILSDINYIFNRYMTMEHGDISFVHPIQQLVCGPDTKPDVERKNGFGIHRLQYEPNLYGDQRNAKEQEINQIIEDIQYRMKNHLKFNDRGKLREYRYSDFCILVGRKTNYRFFQKKFAENDIPLNIIMKTDLRSINSILLIKSILNLIEYMLNNTPCDVKHLFTSIARSYIYQYSDKEIFEIVSKEDEEDSLRYVKKDKIYQNILAFARSHKDSKFSDLYLDMINEFSIVKKLYLIGQVEDNVQKIESLYRIITSMEQTGAGREEFLNLFHSIEKNRLTIESESVVQMDDAVDLMTIHASKGLDKKIVYMPLSENEFHAGENGKEFYTISDKYGILLSNFQYDYRNVNEEGLVEDLRVHSLPYYAFMKEMGEKNPDLDEHVRLVYVALTRAIYEIIIVGNKPGGNEETLRKEDNLYGMLSFLPHRYLVNKKILPFIQEHKDLVSLHDEMMLYSNALMRFSLSLTPDSFPYSYQYVAYQYIGKKLVYDTILALYEKARYNLKCAMLNHLDHLLPTEESDDDSIFSFYCADDSIHAKSDFEKYQARNDLAQREEEIEEDDDSLEETEEVNADPASVRNEVLDKIKKYRENKGDKKLTETVVDYLLTRLIYPLYHTKTLLLDDYQTDDYPDLNRLVETSVNVRKKQETHIELDSSLTRVDDEITFAPVINQTASHTVSHMEDEEIADALEKGTRLHRLMELVSFTTKDTSFIRDKRERALIDRILKNEIFVGVDDDCVQKEFAYYDEIFNTSGSIDLLIHKGDTFIIVDYKTSDISPLYYDEQLHVYQRNIMNLYHVDKDKIKLLLLSLTTGKIREVKTL